MKIFNIDSFKISIDDALFNKAVEYGVLDKEISEEEIKGNKILIKNLIQASSCKTIEDLKNFSFESLRKQKTDEEISKSVSNLLAKEISY